MAKFSNDDLYAPCFCGSGQKLKFCCAKKVAASVGGADSAVIERALELVDAGEQADARTLLEDVVRKGTRDPRALNTLALLRFAMGDIDDGVALARAVWTEFAPGNAFAGGTLAHMMAALGHTAEAERVADQLVRVPLLSEVHGHAAVCALAALGRDADVVTVADKTPEPKSAVVLAARALALVNLGRVDEARPALRRAIGGFGARQSAWLQAILSELERGVLPATPWGRQPLLPPTAWVPGVDVWEQIHTAGLDEGPARIAQQFPIVVEMFKQLVDSPERDARAAAVQMLASTKTSAARDALLTLAAGTFGDDDLRMAAAAALQGAELVDAGAAIPVRLAGRVQDLRLRGGPGNAASRSKQNRDEGAEANPRRWLTPAQMEARYRVPDALVEPVRAALQDVRNGKGKRALEALRRLAQRAPKNPTLRFNLITTQVQVDGDEETAERDLRALLVDHPEYLYARAQLALVLRSQHRIADAKAVLDISHIEDEGFAPWVSRGLVALGEIAIADGDTQLAAQHGAMAQQLGARPDEMSPALALAVGSAAMLKRSRERDEQKESRRRHRVLDPSAGVDHWFADRTVEQLRRTLRALRAPSKGPRAALLAHLKEALLDASVVEAAIADLSGPARAAWDELRSTGWSMSCDAFSAACGSDEDGGDDGDDILEELVERALAVVGAWHGVPSVVVPPLVRAQAQAFASSVDDDDPVISTLSWTIGSVDLPATRDEDGETIVPLLVLVVANDGRVVSTAMAGAECTRVAVEEAVRRALEEPMRGAPAGRPARVVVEDEESARAVRAVLDQRTLVEIGDTSDIDDAATSLLDHLNRTMGPPPTYLTADVQTNDVAALFRAAATLHRVAPWKVLPNDRCLLQLRCEAASLDVTACIIGQAGTAFGIVLYESVDSFRRWRQAIDEVARPEDLPLTLGLHFEPAEEMPDALVEEIDEHGWPVDGEDALPLLIKNGDGSGAWEPTRADLRRLEACALVVTTLVQRNRDALRAMPSRAPALQPVDVTAGGERLRVMVDAVVFEENG